MTFQVVELQTISTDLLIAYRASGGQYLATGCNVATKAHGNRTWFDIGSTFSLVISSEQSQRAEGVDL